MKAWRMHAFGDVRFEEVPMPELKPGWVLAKVRVVQPSVTEIGMMEDPQFYIWGGNRPSLKEAWFNQDMSSVAMLWR